MKDKVDNKVLTLTDVIDTKVDSIYVEYKGLTFEVKPLLSLPEMMGFISGVVKSCFTEDGVYLPEAKDFAIKYSIVSEYSNIVLPEDLQEAYTAITMCDDLIELILGNINHVQFDNILVSIDEKIAYLTESSVMEINKRCDDLLSALERVAHEFGNIMDEVSPEMVQQFISAFSDGKFDEASIVRAILNEKKPEADSV